MAVNRTPNLGLHDWLGTEYVKREEIVENFRKIDNEFGASGRVGDLSKKIGILNEQLADKLSQNDNDPISTSYIFKENTNIKVNKKGYWYYQAIIKNPLKNIAYTNEIVGIRASFDYDECPSIDHIQVLDENGLPIAFEWEPAKDPKQGFDYGTYKTAV